VCIIAVFTAKHTGTEKQREQFNRILKEQDEQYKPGVSKWQQRMDQEREKLRKLDEQNKKDTGKTIIIVAIICLAAYSCASRKGAMHCPKNPNYYEYKYR
jgi:hypothetical protein